MLAAAAVTAADVPPPDWVPELQLAYRSPTSNEPVFCDAPCRRFEVPAGTVLEVRVQVANHGGEARIDGAPWDLWWDQRLHPFPAFDTAACMDGTPPVIDPACWEDLLARVDWERWRDEVPDLSCIPEEPGACRDVRLRVPTGGADHGGLPPGSHSVALWVDRFGATAESNELDNFAGPIRVVVTGGEGVDSRGNPAASAVSIAAVEAAGAGTLIAGTARRPFAVAVVPEDAETSFTLGSTNSRASLPFTVAQPGEVVVEVAQIGSWDEVLIEVRKVSTGEVLEQTISRGRVELTGTVGRELLRDDQRFEVVVTPERGTRGARGSIRATYPVAVRLVADR